MDLLNFKKSLYPEQLYTKKEEDFFFFFFFFFKRGSMSENNITISRKGLIEKSLKTSIIFRGDLPNCS